MSQARPHSLPLIHTNHREAPVSVAGRPSRTAPLVVFDLDGTLVDTAPDLCDSLNHCLDRAGLPLLTLADVRPHAGHGSRAMLTYAYARGGRDLDAETLADQTACFLAYYEAHIAEKSRPFPGVADCLDRLAASGFALAVCTNKFEGLARLLLDTLGLADRFAAICGADTFHRRKPDPVHLLGTIQAAGGDPANAVLVGDTRTDIDAAWAAGVPSILIDFGHEPTAQAERAADYRISSFDALTDRFVGEILADSDRRVASA